MNDDLDNRWSDAARLAALAVRKARAMMANPRKDKPVPKKGGLARKAYPMVYAGGSPSFDERTATRKIPEKNIWIPPNGGVGTQYEEGMKGLSTKKNFYVDAKGIPQPNIFYSSTGPQGPLDRQTQQGILRWDPENPLDASELGYNTGKGKSGTKAMPPKRGGTGKPKVEDRRFYIIGGKRYIKIGNKLSPYDKTPAGEMRKTYYQK